VPPLRKVGVRSPWLPGPLQANLDPLRQTIVIGAIVPALLLGGTTKFIGRPAPPEDTSRPARPAIVQTPPAPVPGASVWMPRPVREQAAPPEDTSRPARPAVVQTPPVPTSQLGASVRWVGVAHPTAVGPPPDPIICGPTQAPITATYLTTAPITATYLTQATLASAGLTTAPLDTDGQTDAPLTC